jgi:hypothetical protein
LGEAIRTRTAAAASSQQLINDLSEKRRMLLRQHGFPHDPRHNDDETTIGVQKL